MLRDKVVPRTSVHLLKPSRSIIAAIFEAPRTDWSELLAGGRNEGVFRVGQHLVRLLPQLPRRVVRSRLELVVGLIIHGLADREKAIAANARRPALATSAYVGLLIDVCVGALSAPQTGAMRWEANDAARLRA